MSKTITKSDIVNHLHSTLGLNKSESKEIVESFFYEINNEVHSYLINITNFNNFLF